MKILKKSIRIFFLSNLAVVGVFILLPALIVTGDIEIINQFVNYITKE
ncbi:hypothetical protein [Jeotgalibacillus sp. S-D1]|nr:hypothetical protein [Jeotgalibacillus sp. S-D1]